MSKSQILRTLVNKRLTAAAEEIFALFETTIAEYERELIRSRDEIQRKQKLLEAAVSPSVLQQQQLGAGDHIPSTSLDQEITKVVIKEEPEEHSVKQEGDELPVPVQVSPSVCVKTEEASQRQHRPAEQGEVLNPEPLSLSERLDHTDRNDHWQISAAPFSFLVAQETLADRNHYIQAPQNLYAPETSATINNMDESGTSEGDETKKHQCSVCNKRFTRKQHLDLHRRVHSGEKPYSCTICERTFALKGTLEVHMRTHTGERPYSCSICKKTFTQTSALTSHRRTHTGEKPFSCPTCKKTFGQKVHLEVHMRSHTGERPYCCSFCSKPFADSYNLKIHMRVHTGEKPYKCSVCQKGFTVSSNLRAHERTHTTS